MIIRSTSTTSLGTRILASLLLSTAPSSTTTRSLFISRRTNLLDVISTASFFLRTPTGFRPFRSLIQTQQQLGPLSSATATITAINSDMTADEVNNNNNNNLSIDSDAAATNAATTTTAVVVSTNKNGDQRFVVLAPMVRTGGAPTRMLALRYGADLVWGPETVDKGVIGSERIFDPNTNVVSFIKGPKAVFTTHTSEKERLIFQLGTADKDLAVQAAKMIAGDVSGIGVNAGCPKHFSVHAGMGAALMREPEKLIGILKALIEHVGPESEYELPISVKIRLLDEPEKTFALISSLCDTGIHNLTLHCRTIPMRPRERVIRDSLQRAADICREKGVLFYVNGDVENRDDAERIMEEYNIHGGAMIATAAETNPSCFRRESEGGLVDRFDMAREFLKIAMDTANHASNTKFCILNLLPGGAEGNPERPLLAKCNNHKQMAEVLKVEYTMSEDADLGTPKEQKRKRIEEKERLQKEQQQRQRQEQKQKRAQEVMQFKQQQASKRQGQESSQDAPAAKKQRLEDSKEVSTSKSKTPPAEAKQENRQPILLES